MLLKVLSRWLLPASLALNVFFGVVAIRHFDRFRPAPPDPQHIADQMAANLAASDATLLQQAFAGQAAAMAEARQAMQAFPGRMRAALEASPFDPEALRTVMENGQAAREGLDHAMIAAFVDAAGKISPDGRRRLAARREPPPPPGWGRPPPPPPPFPGFGPPPPSFGPPPADRQ